MDKKCNLTELKTLRQENLIKKDQKVAKPLTHRFQNVYISSITDYLLRYSKYNYLKEYFENIVEISEHVEQFKGLRTKF
jgi:hypothetical protein